MKVFFSYRPPYIMVLAKFSAIPFWNVKIHGGFWGSRQEIIHKNTLSITYKRLLETGRIDALKLTWKPGMRNPPHVFWDSDVAKWVESAAFCLKMRPDPDLEALLNEVANLIVKSQQPDGYINSHFVVVEPEKRFTDLRDWHELYCAGHLMEAAVAHYEATGKTNLLDALAKYADLIDSLFGREPGKRRGYCGHEEIELALVKLGKATKNEKYLKLAQYFINERGESPYYFVEEAKLRGEKELDIVQTLKRMEYYQAHCPPREQEEMLGHAVRMNYLCSGMADVANEFDDKELFEACKTLFLDGITKKMYITGGIGTSASNEGFTAPYDLPNETAYAETCASIALAFFAHRMLQFNCSGVYADTLERCLYNGTISGISLDGTKFLYENPLAVNPAVRKMERNDWFGCSCCPNNITRLIASLGAYCYSIGTDELAIHLYVQGDLKCTLGGQPVTIKQETNYPWEGMTKITFDVPAPTKFCVKMRIPGWCRQFNASVNGNNLGVEPERGYISITKEWLSSDNITLKLDMPAETVNANPKVAMDSGRVALQRGPLIYCLEQIDNGTELDLIKLSKDAKFTEKFEPDLLGGMLTLSTKAEKAHQGFWENKLYSSETAPSLPVNLKAIPYFAWGNRGSGEMEVWIRRAF